ncbi:Gfo/Idh/MocA family protein [Polaromonas jejuensis]|uniref:Gfo/Idh/MocA family protein n=1 Tax=Polaromonas jejuensis TaxID=457502 RepID=A0ABW0QAJ8_9BURK|nr:Gfo/Idh/MocA family oxidoreductase [Polaromonas jejuensis]
MTRRVVWVGCGRHAEQMLLPQLSRHDIELVGVCDINLAAAEMVARRYGVQHVATDYKELLALPSIDVVGMAAGPVQHRDISIAALNRGINVFMEKPCGATAADAKAIQAAARAAGKTVGVGFMKRYSTGNRMAYNVVKSPEFGKVSAFFGEYMTAPTYFTGNVDYTGFYLHHCVHYMDLVRYYVAPVTSVTVFRNEISPGKQVLHVHFGFENGAIGTVVMGTIQSRGTPVERIQVMGDQRRVEVDGVIEVNYFRNPPFKADDPAASLTDGVDTLSWKPNFTAAANEDFKGYNALFAAYFDALDGKATDLPTIDDGVLAMQVLEAMLEGIANPGKTIALSHR